MKIHLPFLLAPCLVMVACGKKEPPAGTPPPVTAPQPETTAAPASTFDTYSGKALDLLKDGRDLAGKYTEEAKKAAAKFNPGTLKEQAATLLTAVEKGDYPVARQMAEKLDVLLKSDLISSTVSFLQINAQEGKTAAIEAIDTYLAKQGVNPKTSAFLAQLKKDIGSIDKQKAMIYTTLAVIFAADIYGGHGAGQLAGMALGLLFDEKDGVFRLQGYNMPVDPELKKMLSEIGLSPSP